MSNNDVAAGGREWARDFGCDVLNPQQCIEQGEIALGTGMPFIMCGETGVGKSDTVFAIFHRLRKLVREGRFKYEMDVPPSHPLAVQAYEEARMARADKGLTELDAPIEFRNWCPAVRDAFSFEGLPYMEVIEFNGEKIRVQRYARSDMIPWNPHAIGIINIRELNRPAAERTLRPILEALESRMCGEHIIPEGFRIVGDINVGDAYNVIDIHDPYTIRRATWVYFANTLEDWLEYMENRYPGSMVAEFLIENPDVFDNHEARINNKVYACAASWTKVHQMIEGRVVNGEYSLEQIRSSLSSLVRPEYAIRLIEYIGRGQKLSPSKILDDYPGVRELVLNYIEDGSGGDIVAAAATATIRSLKAMKPDTRGLKERITNFCSFFVDLPLEVAQNTALELAPAAARLGARDVETRRPENQETVEMIQRTLMFHPKAHERLALLNQIIAKRSPAPR